MLAQVMVLDAIPQAGQPPVELDPQAFGQGSVVQVLVLVIAPSYPTEDHRQDPLDPWGVFLVITAADGDIPEHVRDSQCDQVAQDHPWCLHRLDVGVQAESDHRQKDPKEQDLLGDPRFALKFAGESVGSDIMVANRRQVRGKVSGQFAG